jgi:outer membrane protein OmpA-like peptidoglycan-associated protein
VENDVTITVNKELYEDTIAVVAIAKTDETNLLTDKLFNTDIYIDKKFVLKAENVVTVYFDFDMHNLKPEAVRKLDSVYTVLTELPAATLQISGYTDGKGSDDYNKKLSDKRARACADYFIQKGIAANRISFESFGACCPLEMELINGRDNPDGRSKNRRALINLTKE